jgi:D-galactarolactone isomerase
MPAAETQSRLGTRAPDGTVDTHIHIYGPGDRYPAAPTARVQAVPGASLDAYRVSMQRLNIDRCVVVQPSTYGADNRCTLDAVAGLGPHRARAVVVVTPDADETELVG